MWNGRSPCSVTIRYTRAAVPGNVITRGLNCSACTSVKCSVRSVGHVVITSSGSVTVSGSFDGGLRSPSVSSSVRSASDFSANTSRCRPVRASRIAAQVVTSDAA